MLDLNDAQEQRQDGIIPDGSYVKIVAHIRRGGVDGDDMPIDAGLLTASKSSDAVMLDFEFTVLCGPHAKRKLWQMMTTKGGKTDENGKSKAWSITKDFLYAMVNSALTLDPKDKSEATQMKRRLPGFAVLDGLEFAAKVGVEYSEDYPDKNKIFRVVVLGDPEYQTVMAGGEVPAKPTSRRTSPRPSAAAAEPVWKQPALPGNGAAPAHVWGQAHPTPQPATQHTTGPGQSNVGPNWLKQ